MQFVRNLFLCCIVSLLVAATMKAQDAASTVTTVVPRLVNFSGKAINRGTPVTGIVGITFSIYSAQEAGAPLWMETQNVQADAKGNYTVQLGATTSEGLPLDLFASGEARWLGVRVNGGEEQPRVLLLSVPYALKAADAQTLGGLPASAFVLAAPPGSTSQPATQPLSSPTAGSQPNVGGSGAEDYIPLWTDNNGDLGNSILYQSGTGSSAKIGINLTKPLFTLDVNGQELVRGLFEMATTNYANKSKGFNSNPLNLESSAFNSTTGTYTLNHFQWQAEPVGNDTTTPGATLNLLYGTDPNQPAETGLNIASSGQIAFAKGQTFPGTGTITGITTASGSGLSGGGTSGNLTLSLVNTCAANQVLQWSGSAWACSSAGTGTITGVTAGTDLTGGGTSGTVTLNLDTTKVPQLNVANSFTGNQTVAGAISATSSGTALTGTMTGNNPNVAAVTGNATATGTGGTWGVLGMSSTSSGAGTVGMSSAGAEGSGVYAFNSGSSGGYGVFATAYGSGGIGVSGSGDSYGVYGSGNSYGVYGSGNSSGVYGSGGSYGVYGGGNTYGVYGSGNSSGVYGSGGTYGVYGSGGTGVYGSSSGGYAVYASASDSNGDYGTAVAGYANLGPAAYFENDSDRGSSATLLAFNNAPTGDDSAYALDVGGEGGQCDVDNSGNLTCDGSKSAVVPVDGGSRKVALYAVEAPENWFEDFGSGQLSNGSARIDLEPTFAQTVNTDLDYHVFLTPKGDCKGLYVRHESATSFEVHELGGGTSSVAFDYRIIAKRKKYETVRLADLTERYKKLAEQRARMHQHRPAAIPAASNAGAALGQKPAISPMEEKQARPIQPAALSQRSTK